MNLVVAAASAVVGTLFCLGIVYIVKRYLRSKRKSEESLHNLKVDVRSTSGTNTSPHSERTHSTSSHCTIQPGSAGSGEGDMTDPNGTNIKANSIGTGIFSSPAQMMAYINHGHDADIDAIPNGQLPDSPGTGLDSPGTVPVGDDVESPGDGKPMHITSPTVDSDVEDMFTDPAAMGIISPMEVDGHGAHNDLEIINEFSNPHITAGGFHSPSVGDLEIVEELSSPRVTLGRMPTEGGNDV